MHASAAVVENTFDGPIDEGLEGAEEAATAAEREAPAADLGAEAAAHALLRMIGEHPGQMGRLRAARIVGGYTVPHRDDEEAAALARYAVQLDWPLKEITRLVDALIDGGLVTQTPGPRPVLVLTRPGHRTLEALEAGPPPA